MADNTVRVYRLKGDETVTEIVVDQDRTRPVMLATVADCKLGLQMIPRSDAAIQLRRWRKNAGQAFEHFTENLNDD